MDTSWFHSIIPRSSVRSPNPAFASVLLGLEEGGGLVPGGEAPQVLCDPLTFVPVEERRLLWNVLEKDAVFVEIPEAFRDVRIAGKQEPWKRHEPFVPSSARLLQPPASTLKGWRDFGGLCAVPVLGLDETLRGQLGSHAGTMLRVQLYEAGEGEEPR